MTTNDKPLTRNYDSDKEKSEIDSDIHVLKIRQRLTMHSGRKNCIYCVSFDSLLSSSISRHALCLYGHALNINFMDHLLNNNLRRSPHFGNDPLKTSK